MQTVPVGYIPSKRRVHHKRRGVASAAPAPTPVSIVSVTALEGGEGVVVFNAGERVITDVTDVSQLELSDNGEDWQACDVIVEFDATSVRMQNPLGFHAGFAWRVL